MKKICAPVRDDSIQSLTLLKDPVDVFKGITEVNKLFDYNCSIFHSVLCLDIKSYNFLYTHIKHINLLHYYLKSRVYEKKLIFLNSVCTLLLFVLQLIFNKLSCK